MTDTLFLRFSENTGDDAEPIEWGVISDDGDTFRARGSELSVSDIIDAAREHLDNLQWLPDEVVMVLPASSMLITRVSIAARRRSQMLRALPFVVEEQLADDLDHVHLAPGTVEAQKPVQVVAIEKGVLRAWLDQVAAADLIADVAVPDVLLASRSQTEVTIHLDGDEALVCSSTEASRVQRDMLAHVVALMAAEHSSEEPMQVTVVHDDHRNQHELALARLESELSQGGNVSVALQLEDADLFQRLCAHYRSADALINVLQGAFQPVRRRGQAPLARYATAAGLLLALIVAHLGFTATEAFMLERQARQSEAQAVALYRQWFPADQRVTVLNIRDRTLAHVKNGAAQAADDEFFGLLGAVARELRSHRTADVQRIGYNESTGQLALELSADGYPTVEGITNSLQENGVSVEITSVAPDEERVTAHLRLERG